MAPRHVAIIMDGNGRWATRRGLPRQAGHVEGADAVRRAVEFAARHGIGVLTLYAFSADNWRRPGAEICALLALFEEYLRTQVDRCQSAGVRLSVAGRRDRLPPSLRRTIERAEEWTRPGAALHLRLAIDYSARDAIWLAAEQLIHRGAGSREELARRVRSGRGDDVEVPDVDLLIRTGGERRLSDFLLWESAYAELCFLDVAWPDFSDEDFAGALAEFDGRERRFGGIAPRAEALGLHEGAALGLHEAPALGCDEGPGLRRDEGPGLGRDEGLGLGRDEGPAMGCDEGPGLGCDEGLGLRRDEGPGLGRDEGPGLRCDEGLGLRRDEGPGLGRDEGPALGRDEGPGLRRDERPGLGCDEGPVAVSRLAVEPQGFSPGVQSRRVVPVPSRLR